MDMDIQEENTYIVFENLSYLIMRYLPIETVIILMATVLNRNQFRQAYADSATIVRRYSMAVVKRIIMNNKHNTCFNLFTSEEITKFDVYEMFYMLLNAELSMKQTGFVLSSIPDNFEIDLETGYKILNGKNISIECIDHMIYKRGMKNIMHQAKYNFKNTNLFVKHHDIYKSNKRALSYFIHIGIIPTMFAFMLTPADLLTVLVQYPDYLNCANISSYYMYDNYKKFVKRFRYEFNVENYINRYPYIDYDIFSNIMKLRNVNITNGTCLPLEFIYHHLEYVPDLKEQLRYGKTIFIGLTEERLREMVIKKRGRELRHIDDYIKMLEDNIEFWHYVASNVYDEGTSRFILLHTIKTRSLQNMNELKYCPKAFIKVLKLYYETVYVPEAPYKLKSYPVSTCLLWIMNRLRDNNWSMFDRDILQVLPVLKYHDYCRIFVKNIIYESYDNGMFPKGLIKLYDEDEMISLKNVYYYHHIMNDKDDELFINFMKKIDRNLFIRFIMNEQYKIIFTKWYVTELMKFHNVTVSDIDILETTFFRTLQPKTFDGYNLFFYFGLLKKLPNGLISVNWDLKNMFSEDVVGFTNFFRRNDRLGSIYRSMFHNSWKHFKYEWKSFFFLYIFYDFPYNMENFFFNKIDIKKTVIPLYGYYSSKQIDKLNKECYKIITNNQFSFLGKIENLFLLYKKFEEEDIEINIPCLEMSSYE